ncbi:MAG: ABC transporter ATP-binding protein [Candidatus Hermodarchaeota archaeon]|nr:ABC transporter ATP-binding protein [Candidatus Hermodarchaeota archaeon]
MSDKAYKSASSYQLAALRRYPGVAIIASGLALFSAYLLTLPSIILGNAIDELAVNGFTSFFIFHVMLILGIALTLFATIILVGYSFAVITLRWERDARQEFFEVVQENSMTFHDQVDSKQLLAVAMQDIRWVRFSLNPAMRNIIQALGTLIISALLLTLIDLRLGIIMAIGAPMYLYFAYRYAVKVEPIRRLRSEQNEKVTAISQEVFRGIEVVRAFGTADREETKFNEISNEYARLLVREGRLASFYIPELILTAITAVAFLFGALQVLDPTSGYTIGTLIQVIGLLAAIDSFSFMLPRFLLVIRGGHVNAKRIINVLNWTDPLQEPDPSIIEIDWTGDIVFDNVSFQYLDKNGGNNSYALKNVNFTIPGGSRVALIGGPGGGKSTVLKLLLRLYDPTEGRVLVGGVDLHSVLTRDVRAVVGLVEQEIFLFRMSVKDNIGFGCVDACQEEIIEAAKKAQADEFIQQLPQGYDTVIGERGMTLSGGQRQRLAIARTLVQDPKILLLDDSVSAIDAQTEYALRKALDEVMKGRTSITVTQRLRTLLESDIIVILDKGELVAMGSHEELLRTSMHYQRIFERLPGAVSYVNRRRNQEGAN